jgi:SAM-dependent methyltransferase
MSATLRIYKWPSQAFWRYFEVKALRQVSFDRPILEIGCGDGQLSAMIFDEIDEAIDINPRSVEKCRQAAGHLYRRLRCLDARQLEFSDGGYATIYANCVLEHIPDVRGVLAGCFRGLRPGGKLVITVPLTEMNRHLLLPWGWYARMRQRQLVHINLLDRQGWEALLQSIGFSILSVEPYLSGPACKFWDALDSPGCIGFGRYRLAPIAGRLAEMLMPSGLRERVLNRLSRWLSAKAQATGGQEPACAVVVKAMKPAQGVSA